MPLVALYDTIRIAPHGIVPKPDFQSQLYIVKLTSAEFADNNYLLVSEYGGLYSDRSNPSTIFRCIDGWVAKRIPLATPRPSGSIIPSPSRLTRYFTIDETEVEKKLAEMQTKEPPHLFFVGERLKATEETHNAPYLVTATAAEINSPDSNIIREDTFEQFYPYPFTVVFTKDEQFLQNTSMTPGEFAFKPLVPPIDLEAARAFQAKHA